MPKFDWYQGTLDENNPSSSLLKELQNSFDLSSWVHGGGYQGYTHSIKLTRGMRNILLIAYGGNDGVHIRCSGEDSEIVARIMRAHYVTHKVSRIDSCMDFEEENLFNTMAKEMMDFANAKKPQPLKISMAGDWSNGKGRTLYIGSRQSQIFIRLYEKGYETSSKLGIEVERPDWVRLEVEYKPQKEKPRRFAQSFKPDDIFRLSYLPDLMGYMNIEVGDAITTYNKTYSDEQRAWTFLLRQYGRTIANRVKSEGGSFENVFKEIEEHVIKNHF